MADDDDDEIGRQIVGAMRRKIEPAHGATIVDLQKSTEQLAFAAARATAAKPALQGRPEIAFFDRAGFAGPDLVGGAHGFHDLALFELPNFSDPAWAPSAANLGLLRLRVSRLAQKPFTLLPRDDRSLQPWLLLLGRGGCSLGSDCVERAGHGLNRSLHAGRSRVALRDPGTIIVGTQDMAFGVLPNQGLQ